MRKFDVIIRVWNYVRLSPVPELHRYGESWSSASDKSIIHSLHAERKFMLLSIAEMAEALKKLSSNNLPRQTWFLIARNQFFIVLKLCITKF